MYIKLNENNYVDGWVKIAYAIPHGHIETNDPIDFNHFKLNYKTYRVIDGVLSHDATCANPHVIEKIRMKREAECFTYINRGKLWYSILTLEQETELSIWYKEWLDLTSRTDLDYDNPQYPTKPTWLI